MPKSMKDPFSPHNEIMKFPGILFTMIVSVFKVCRHAGIFLSLLGTTASLVGAEQASGVSIDTSTTFIPYGPNHPLEKAKQRSRRNLQFIESSDDYRNIRIVMVDDLDGQIEKNRTTSEAVEIFRTRVIKGTSEFWGNALKVYPVPANVSIYNSNCGVLPLSEPVFNADLVVDVRLSSIPACNRGVSAYSTLPCEKDQYFRPLTGVVGVCDSMLKLLDERDIDGVTRIMIHELGHLLGVAFSHLPYFFDFETGLRRTPDPEFQLVPCLNANRSDYASMPGNTTARRFEDEDGSVSSRRYEIVTPTVRAVARNQFNCQSLNGARWENQDNGCLGAHWDNRVFHTELMAASSNVLLRNISPLTLALLEDSGWYLANYSMSTMSPFGHAAGCSFVDEPCLVDGVSVADYAQGFFCDMSSFAGCISSHTEWRFCDLLHHESVPDEFQYFDSNETLGGLFAVLDYCPSYTRSRLKVKDWSSTNIGTSTDKDAEAFSLIRSKSCLDPKHNSLDGNIAQTSIFEVHGPDSRCFNSNVQVPGATIEVCDWFGRDCELLSNVQFQLPLCLQSRCSEEKHAVEVYFGEVVHTCAYDGERVELPDVPGSFIECPRLAQICPTLICPYNCAGRGVCDYSLTSPKCICNDPDDSSPGCFHSPRFSLLEENIPSQSPTTTAAAGVVDSVPTASDASSIASGGEWWWCLFVGVAVTMVLPSMAAV